MDFDQLIPPVLIRFLFPSAAGYRLFRLKQNLGWLITLVATRKKQFVKIVSTLRKMPNPYLHPKHTENKPGHLILEAMIWQRGRRSRRLSFRMLSGSRVLREIECGQSAAFHPKDLLFCFVRGWSGF